MPQLVTLHFRSMLGFTVLFILLSLVKSCQEINVKAKDGGVIVGRSLEFGVPLDYFLITEPAGTKHVAPALPKCPGDPFTFSNRYKQITFKGIFRGKWTNTMDGINAAGLSASVLYFKDNAEYIDPAEITGVSCDNAIPQTMVAAYILAMYKTVEQVKNDLAYLSGKPLNIGQFTQSFLYDATFFQLTASNFKGILNTQINIHSLHRSAIRSSECL